jgi:hypothetical protein
MAITLQYQPNANLLGGAAYQIGLGEALRRKQQEDQAQQMRAAQLAEQQRQFDITNARAYDQAGQQQYQFDQELSLKQQAMADEQENIAFNQKLAEHRDKLARYGIMQQGASRDAQIQGQLAETDLRGQYALMGDQLGLVREQMQQQGLTERAGQEMQGRFGIQWQAQAAKQMQADWQNIQKILPRLDESEREDLISQFQQRWENANVPMPVELPVEQLPEWMDPNAQWQHAREWQTKQRELGNDVLLVPGEDGMPSIPRGWPQWSQTPQGVQAQNEAKIKQEKIKSQNKAAEAEVKKQEAFDMSELSRMDAEMKAAQAEDKHAQAMRQTEDNHFATMQKNLADLQLKIANAKSKEPKVDEKGNAAPAIDTSEMEKTVADYKRQIEEYKARRASDNADPFAEPQSMPAPTGPVRVSSPAEAAKLPKGTQVILPDGRAGVVK